MGLRFLGWQAECGRAPSGDTNVVAVVFGTPDAPVNLGWARFVVVGVAQGSFAAAGSHIGGIAVDIVRWGFGPTVDTADLTAGGDVVEDGANCPVGDTSRRLKRMGYTW